MNIKFLPAQVATLKASNGDVALAGNPEYAGFHFHPHHLAKSVKYLFHADAIIPEKDTDLPWISLFFTIGDQNYHSQHMSHSTIPQGNRYFTGGDGRRFGASASTRIATGESLRLCYRILLTKGPSPDRRRLQQNYDNFVNPPTVKHVK